MARSARNQPCPTCGASVGAPCKWDGAGSGSHAERVFAQRWSEPLKAKRKGKRPKRVPLSPEQESAKRAAYEMLKGRVALTPPTDGTGGALYRKKPVVIEARQLGRDYDTDCEIVAWCGGRAVGEDYGPHALLVVTTLEGEMIGNTGDWIIKGVQGEFYPCKPDIFEATYEAVAGLAPSGTTTLAEGDRVQVHNPAPGIVGTVAPPPSPSNEFVYVEWATGDRTWSRIDLLRKVQS